MGIRDAVKRAVYGYKATSETYVAHLRAIGVEVGEDCEIFCPHETSIDTLNPHLLTIGDHVAITGPATILTHDYSVGVIKTWTHGEVLGDQKPVEIGSNVFLAWGCTVLPGTTIGDDVVIGAGAVVTGKIAGGRLRREPRAAHMHHRGLLRAPQAQTAPRGGRGVEALRGALRPGAGAGGVP